MAMVLIVEDNPVNRDVLGRRLERRGYKVRFAESGPEGIRLSDELLPDIILMDIGLGEMDGWEATRRIKANARTNPIPVMALTASAFESDRIKSLEAGCAEFETKPVDLPRLLGKMEMLMAAAAMENRG